MFDKLSKKDKAALRELIEKGLQYEFTRSLTEADGIIQKWQQKKLAGRDAYHALYKSLKKNDYFIARRYDAITGSRYLVTVIGIYGDKQITDEDLQSLSAEVREYIKNVDASL